jgi:hypothetical protein
VPPIEPIDLNQFELNPEPPTFGPLWAQFFSEADGLDSKELIDAGLTSLPDLAAVAASMDVPFDIASRSLAAEFALPADPELTKAESNSPLFAASFDQIRLAIPDEAFQPIPRDLLPPPELGGFNSTGAPGPGAPAPAPSPGSPGSPPPGYPGGVPSPSPGGMPIQPQAQLRNTTRPGATDFNEGDGFLLEIRGAKSGSLQVLATLNGVKGQLVAYGSLDANGYRAITGLETAGQKGEWFQTWYVNGEQALPVLHFFVN